MLKYDGLEYDLDSLFQYEILKKIIEALAKNQTQLNQRILELEDKEYNPTAKGNYHRQNNFSKRKDNSNSDLTVSSYMYDTENNKSKLNSQRGNDSQDNQIKEKEEDEEAGDEGDKQLNWSNNKIISRIKAIEKKLKEVHLIRKLIKATDKKIDSQNANLQSVSEKVEVNSIETYDMMKDIDDIKKAMSNDLFNNYDMVENDNDNMIGGGIKENNVDNNEDNNRMLIRTLEMKMVKKFSFVEHRIKSLENEDRKTKQEQTDNKNNIQQMGNQMSQLNEDTSQNNKEIIEMINSKTNQLDTKFNEKIDGLINEINMMKQEELNPHQNTITITNTQEQDAPKETVDKDVMNQLMQKLNKRIRELEKGMNGLKDYSTNKINEIKDSNAKLTDSIAKLKESVNEKHDKNNQSNSSNQLSILDNKLNELKDFTEQLEKTVFNQSNDVKLIFKKVDNISGSILDRQDSSKDMKKSPDGVKFVPLRTYNTEMAKIAKEIDSIVKVNDEFKKQISDLQTSNSNSVSKVDLNKLDKALRALIEEYKLALQKKFANKLETNKSIRVIDQQLKQLLIDIENRTEKNDTCLLASKPIGYKCASCEAEIENYDHNKLNYLPWKNYPMRDYEISYRVSIINIIILIINSKEMDSVDFFKR